MKLSTQENQILKLAVYEEELNKKLKFAATAEDASNMAVQELQRAVEDPTYLDKIWNWLGKVKDRLGNEWNSFLDQLKSKGGQILQQLGVTEEQLASLGAPTTY